MASTLEDVSKQSGYSIATISRVVNGAEGVSSEVRSTVEKAIRDLGYRARRSRSNQGDRAQGERLVEVILHRRSTMEPLERDSSGIAVGPVTKPDPDVLLASSSSMTGDFYRSILDGVLNELRAHGGKAVVQVVTDLESPALVAGLQQDVDGVLLVGEGGPHLTQFIAGCRHPLVLVDIIQAGGRTEQVTSDNFAGIGQAVAHLAELGHRRVGCITAVDDLTTRERSEAFLFHAMRHRLTVPAGWAAVPYESIAETTGRVAALLRGPERPSGVVCCNDYGALAVIRAAEQVGLVVPRDLSVVGFDDTLMASVVSPPLTTVRVNGEVIGGMAVRLILTKGGQATPAGTIVRVPTRLVVRSSTAPPAA